MPETRSESNSPWLGSTLEAFGPNKKPTCCEALRRLRFLVDVKKISRKMAARQVAKEICEIWTDLGEETVSICALTQKVLKSYERLNKLNKVPASRRLTENFLEQKEDFLIHLSTTVIARKSAIPHSSVTRERSDITSQVRQTLTREDRKILIRESGLLEESFDSEIESKIDDEDYQPRINKPKTTSPSLSLIVREIARTKTSLRAAAIIATAATNVAIDHNRLRRALQREQQEAVARQKEAT